MRLSEIKAHLRGLEGVNFKKLDGSMVPEHFHITEVGIVTKDFIDCGGTVRHEKVANFQLWDANDYEHRLKAGKLLSIIALSEKKLGIADLEIEVEYQSETIGRYDLGFDGVAFTLLPKQTACLALDKCGVPQEKTDPSLREFAAAGGACCTPGSGCC